jgi:hypothetical protein
METNYIGIYKVTFDPISHQYTVDDKPVKSVTQLISDMLPKTYKNVDPAILKKAADKGIALHDAIERFERFGEVSPLQEFRSYLHLKRFHAIHVLENEKIVVVSHHGVPICAGRFDMIIESPHQKGKGIADVKRTAHIFPNHLSLQLNLYKLGYEQTYKEPISYLKCLHLRYDHADYIDVAVDKKMLLDVLDAYYDKYVHTLL